MAGAQADLSISYLTGFGIGDRSDASGYTPLLAAGQQAKVQLIYAGADSVAVAHNIKIGRVSPSGAVEARPHDLMR